MKYTRFYTGADGKSHFEDVEIPMKNPAPGRLSSDDFPMKNMSFRETSPDVEQKWHPESRRQFGITLDGEVEVSLSDGTTRRFGPGEVFLAEDLTGQGHILHIVGGKSWRVLLVPLV
jgi:quercetin dioxygenase-like cupin family protein